MQKRRILLLVLGLLMTFLVVACTPDTVSYTVTFNSHGGPSVSSQTIEKDGLVNDPLITRSGFTLDGWYTESAYTTKWIFATSKVTGDMTLHAKWTEVGQTTYTLTFDTDGGSTVANQTRTNGATFGNLPEPTKSGFSFGGWYLDAARTQAVVSTAVVSSHTTLYAKWVEASETFTVTFNPGAGEVVPGSRTVAQGATVLVPNTDYPNHELIGWYTESTFDNAWDFDVDTVTSDMTLYAKWAVIPDGIAITTPDEFYNLVNGTTVYETGAEFYLRNDLDFTGFNWDGALFAESLINPHNFNLNGNGKTISNISFTATNQAGIIQRMSGGSVFNLTLEDIHVEGASQGGVLVGRIVNGSTITFSDITVKNASVKGGAAGVAGLIGHIQGAATSSTVVIERVAMLNIDIESNSNAASGLVGDVESSKLTINDVIVDAVVTTTGERVGGLVGEARRNSGSQDLPEVVIDGAVVYVNLSGLRYLGAVIGRADSNMTNLDPEIHGEASKILPGSISNVILIGNYVAAHDNPVFGHLGRSNLPEATNAYAVAFNINKAALTGLNVVEANTFASISLLPASAFDGFSHVWITQAGMLPEFDNGLAIDLGFEVTIHLDEAGTQVQYVRAGQEISEIYFAPEAGEFMGWTSDEANTIELVEITEDTNAYAKFMDVFVVTYESNEGSVVANQDVFDGELAIEPADPTRFGFEFTGWYLEDTLTTLFDFSTPITTDMTLYAGWNALTLAEFTVSFETNGAEAISPVTVLDGGQVTLPPLPTKEGFIFDGWFTDSDLENAFVASTPIIADMTLYAGWVIDAGGEAPEGIPIQTAQEFYDMATGSNEASLSATYYLAMDIDFTGFTWVGVPATFSGELNGNGKTLSNLTYDVDSTSVFNGLFHMIDGAKIHNFTIENFTFTSSVGTTRSAFIAGQVHGSTPSYIEHITIRNSSISANEYVAAVVGRATGSSGSQVHIANIVVEDVTIKGYYVAGIIGDLDGPSAGSTISDIWVKADLSGAQNVRLTSERLGGIVGRARSSATSVISRVYMDITAVADKWAAGIAGDVAAGALEINDVFVTGTITTSNNSGRSVAGNNGTNATVVNAYEYAFTGTGTGGVGATVLESTPDQTWWHTNLTSLTQSLLWQFNETSNMYELKRLSSDEIIAPTLSHAVTFETDGVAVVADQVVLDGELAIKPEALVLDGYTFVGWFVNLLDANPFDFSTPITDDLSLFAVFVDDISPTIEVMPSDETVLLAVDETFKLIVTINDANPYALEVDHSYEGTLPEFTVYAQALSVENPFGPYGSEQAMTDFASQGVIVTYDEALQTWTIDFGVTITAMFADNNVTFYLVAKDVFDNQFGSMDPTTPENTFTFIVDVVMESYTVSFDVDGGSEILDITVLEGALLELPEAPTKPDFDFAGWFTDVDRTLAFDQETLITEDLTLYAKWVEAVVDPFEGYTAITTPEQFIAVASQSNSGEQFYVANDLNFTGVLWEQSGSGTAFAGYIDGNNKSLSNINITSSGTGIRGGMFQRVNGATIKNMIIDNATVAIVGRAGILIGASDSSSIGATLENITILNSSVSGSANEGTGILIGQVGGGLWNISNIRIDNSLASTTAKNAALLVGRSDGTLNFENIYVTSSSAQSSNANTDSGVGGLVGYLNNAASSVDALNVVFIDIELGGRGAGFIIGYNNVSSAINIENMYTDVTFVFEGTNGQHGMIGRRNSGGAVQVVTDVYAFMVDAQTSGAEQVPEGFLLLAPFTNTDFSNDLPMIYTNEFFSSLFIA